MARQNWNTPLPIAIAVAVILVLSTVQAIFYSTSALNAGVAVIAVLVAFFLSRGSVLAWALAVLSGLAEISAPIALGGPMWIGAAGLILVVCLVVPTSCRYVWAGTPRTSPSWGQSDRRQRSDFPELLFDLSGWLFRIGPTLDDLLAAKALTVRKLAYSLAFWLFVCLPLVGALNNLRHGSAAGNEFVDLSWHVLWITWNLILFSLVALLVRARISEKSG